MLPLPHRVMPGRCSTDWAMLARLIYEQYNYRPQRSCGQGNIFTPVCHSVHRGVSASVHAGIPPPPEQTAPGADTCLGADTRWSRHTLEQTLPSPQEQTHPPPSRHSPRADTPPPTPPPEQTPPRADTPPEQTPPGADSGIRSMSGWYASYWNAFLFWFLFSK